MDDSTENDLNRTAELEKFGITVIRFSNDQVVYNLDSVIKQIQQENKKLTPL
jgi:very-short-patch-repair endonuclease